MRLGIDMDGVLADFTGSALRRIKDRWGVEIKYEDILEPSVGLYTYDLLNESEKARFKNPKDIYREVSPPGFFEQLTPYDGVIDTFKKLNEQHDIVVITKPIEWEHCPGEKYRWLYNCLGYKPNVIMVNSMDIKGLIDVDIMIDDDPRVIKNLTTAVPIVIERPWNKEFLKFEAVRSVKSFNDVIEVIEQIKKDLYFIQFKGI